MVFEDAEENKLIYTDIHREYVNITTNCFSSQNFVTSDMYDESVASFVTVILVYQSSLLSVV